MAIGHRARLREKIIKKGMESLTEQERLEFLLFCFVVRKDTTPIAKRLLEEFGNVNNVLHASPEALRLIGGLSEQAALTIAELRSIVRIAEEEASRSTKHIYNAQMAGEYVNLLIGNSGREKTVAVYLTADGDIICSREIDLGTSKETEATLREIATNALKVGAEAIILGHNHPSGRVNPSDNDLNTTKALKEALKQLGIVLMDHVIVSNGQYCSLVRSDGDKLFINEIKPGTFFESK